jgi:hypothetical protein
MCQIGITERRSALNATRHVDLAGERPVADPLSDAGDRVNGHRVQVREGVGYLVFRIVCGCNGIRQCYVCDHNGRRALESMADPSKLQGRDGQHPGAVFPRVSGTVGELRFDAVHNSATDAAHGAP